MRQRCVLDGDLRLGSTPFFAHSFILWFCSLNGNRRMAFLRRNAPRALIERLFVGLPQGTSPTACSIALVIGRNKKTQNKGLPLFCFTLYSTQQSSDEVCSLFRRFLPGRYP